MIYPQNMKFERLILWPGGAYTDAMHILIHEYDCIGSLGSIPNEPKSQKNNSKGTRKLRECIFSHVNPKSFWGPKVGPRPTPIYARFTHMTLLHYVRKIGPTRVGTPLDQILDPLLAVAVVLSKMMS